LDVPRPSGACTGRDRQPSGRFPIARAARDDQRPGVDQRTATCFTGLEGSFAPVPPGAGRLASTATFAAERPRSRGGASPSSSALPPPFRFVPDPQPILERRRQRSPTRSPYPRQHARPRDRSRVGSQVGAALAARMAQGSRPEILGLRDRRRVRQPRSGAEEPVGPPQRRRSPSNSLPARRPSSPRGGGHPGRRACQPRRRHRDDRRPRGPGLAHHQPTLDKDYELTADAGRGEGHVWCRTRPSS